MKTIIKGNKLASLVKSIVLMTAVSFGGHAYAEYYVAYTVRDFGGCSTPCCGSSCGGRMVNERRPVQQIYSPPLKKVKYYQRSRYRDSYNRVMVYYVWPTYSGAVWAPACGGGCAQPVMSNCGAPPCSDFFVPPQYYTTVSNADQFMDQRTADDF